ncbi:GNAT family N-acetyltransferase [Micromonospora krabiensis]|uniref:Protein N-acetyltransferase, RimJ/RimL family n=1 Tax=Micromonospora krabiensis TaxID=307121 RepID=A0A1C3N2G0_9ACTN|nr:GNAT family protein [Micromonospora krabiensis]SBV26748.1 Protein N-acetyltransferase, RimJ/RimL family [Micromonospora krabiensis]
MEQFELTADGLLLRPWRDADAPAVRDALRDPDIARWNPQGGPVDEASALLWVRRRADWSAGDHVSLAVATTADDELLGSVSLHQIRGENAGIGYWTVPAARGRGVASRSVDRLTRWAFDALRLHRVELCHAVANTASCRVAERAGYAAEGTLRESYRYGDGRRHDEHLHARLASDR